MPDFSIITPSLNMLPYLRRCVRSVGDQQGVDVEHIIMDGGSSDGTLDWLRGQHGLRVESGRDSGMYDALNKGIDRARGMYVAYLNCDEQYLQEALLRIRRLFEAHPRADLIFGGSLLVRPDGRLLAFRRAYPVRWPYVAASHLYALSCAMFFRRSVFDAGLRFDRSLRDAADMDFVIRALQHQFPTLVARGFYAAFTVTGSNRSAQGAAHEELLRVQGRTPGWVRLLRWPLNGARIAEKILSGGYSQRGGIRYAVYAGEDLAQRTCFNELHPSSRWPRQR